MPRSTQDPARAPNETPAGLRTMAGHARRLARNTTDDQARTRLTEFAEELEARAAELEIPPQTFSHDAAAAIKDIEDDAEQS